MKFQKIIVILLSLILTINAIGMGILIKEEKKQTENTLYTAVLTEVAARTGAYTVKETWASSMYEYYSNKANYASNKISSKNREFYDKVAEEINEIYYSNEKP